MKLLPLLAGIFILFSGYSQNKPSFEVENININDVYSNFGAAYYGEDNIVFSSSKGTGSNSWVNPKDSDRFYNLYIGGIQSFDTISDVRGFRPSFLSNFHESNLVFSKDLSQVYITQSNQRKGDFVRGDNGMINLKVYKFVKDESGKWGPMIDLPFNSDNFSVAHPALSPDGKTLYVASDKPGSFGGTDIYQIDINEDGTYGEMKNLGPEVNSQYKESFPFIGSNSVLYFSSDRSGGMGGLDVYASRKVLSYFTEPVSLESPINSEKDDFSLIIRPEENTGYFSSNRNGGVGGDDLYSFRQTSALNFECQQLIEGQISSLDNGEVLSDVSVLLLDDFGNAVDSAITDQEGNYVFVVGCEESYTIMVNHFGYFRKDKPVQTGDDLKEVLVFDFDLEKEVVVKNEKEQLNLNPIFFELNSSYLTEQAMLELDRVVETMKKYPSMKIAIGSHTDSRSEADYNLWLSGRRANRTREYIIDQGIEADRLTAKGFGESEILNNCNDNSACSEEEHGVNRRSEFVIVENPTQL
jgi:outer membrane protein OmpA-like peptidoglycan-associated protein